MSNESAVQLKGKKDGLLIILNEEFDFETIKKELLQKVHQSKKFLAGSKCAVAFQGRELSDQEAECLVFLLNEHGDMDISFMHKNTKKPPSATTQRRNSVKAVTSLLPDECITKIHRGSVRSGQELNFDGSIIVLGDVNPGGYITATENIIVLGALKGQAHAGVNGNANAFVASIFFAPTQLRIADIITRFPDDASKKVQVKPEYAYIENNNICIVPIL